MGRRCLAEVERFLADLNESRKLETMNGPARDPKSHKLENNCRLTLNPARFRVPDHVESDGQTPSAETDHVKREYCNHQRICLEANCKFEALSSRLSAVEKISDHPIHENWTLKTKIEILEREVLTNSMGLSLFEILNGRSGIQQYHRPGSTSTPAAFDPGFFGTSPAGQDKPASSAQAAPACMSTPPPAPPAPSYDDLLPPPPPMTVGTMAPVGRPSFPQSTSSSPANAANKTYCRIPITEEILKSVVLKPPSARKFKNRSQ